MMRFSQDAMLCIKRSKQKQERENICGSHEAVPCMIYVDCQEVAVLAICILLFKGMAACQCQHDAFEEARKTRHLRLKCRGPKW